MNGFNRFDPSVGALGLRAMTRNSIAGVVLVGFRRHRQTDEAPLRSGLHKLKRLVLQEPDTLLQPHKLTYGPPPSCMGLGGS